MLHLAIALLIGNLIAQHLPELPGLSWSAAAIIAVGSLVVAVRSPVIGGFGAGLFWALAFAQLQLGDRLDPKLEGIDQPLTGTVAGLPRTDPVLSRFEFIVDPDARPPGVPERLRLGWYRPATVIEPGQRWRMSVRLKRPHGFMNPGGFDYEGWLFRRGIGATGYVRESPAAELLDPGSGRGLDRLRHRLSGAIQAALPDRAGAGVIAALAVGDRSGITPQAWDVFAATGTSHLMAISGLHIGLVAGLAFWLVRRLWTRSARLCGLWPASHGAALTGLLAGGGYAALAGFSLPTQRALIMLAVALGAVLLARNVRPTQALAAALILVLAFDPPASLTAGFWLSFGAVAVIVYLATGRLRRPRGAHHWALLQLGLGLALLPLLLWFFQSAPLIAPLANALAIPWVGLVVIPMTLLATAVLTIVPIVGEWGLQSIELLLRPVWPVLGGLAGLPLARWEAATPSVVALLFALAGVALLLAPRGVPGRWLGALLLLPLVLGGPQGPPAGGFRLTVLDVGQGLAAVVQTPRHTLVFDTGARFGGGLDIGRAALVPFLRAGGIGEVDRLVVSHGDIDHSGGARSLLDSLPVSDVLVGPGVGVLHRRQESCRAGQHWSWDGVYFSVLSPEGGEIVSENNGSCVIRVEGAGGTALLIADIEAAAESRLLEVYARWLPADLLLVPHHGSRSSSSSPFVDAVEPRWAIVSAGYRNRYGFPKDAVCRRYADRGIPVLETSVEGAITIDVHPTLGPDEPRSYRGRARRYWHIPKDGNCSPL